VAGVMSLVRGAAKGRPYLGLLRDEAHDGVEIGILQPAPPGVPGAMEASRRASELLGAPLRVPPPGHGLLVYVAVGGDDPTSPAASLAEHVRAGGRSLLLLACETAGRERLERHIRNDRRLGLGSIAHVRSLEREGAEAAIEAVCEALGKVLPGTARRYPAIREQAASVTIGRAARRAATIGAAGAIPGTAMPVLTLLQGRLVMDLARIHDRPIGQDRALELAAVVAAGFGWRALGRGAVLFVPGPAFALRASVAYAATQAIGQAASKWLAEGGGAGDDRVSEITGRIEDAIRRIRPGGRG
jgi:uncharacterized protein (DUF697 family)